MTALAESPTVIEASYNKSNSASQEWLNNYSGCANISLANDNLIFYKVFVTAPIMSEKAIQIISKLNSFKALQPNWDSYGAIPPRKSTIDKAISTVKKFDENQLPLYFTAPGPNGELVIEFKNGEKEAAAYINPDGSTELVMNEGDNFVLEGTLEDNYKDLLKFINF